MTGYFLMHRGWQDNPIFDREEYSRRDAWVWLIENATWKPTRARVKGEMIDLERGELCFAQRFLAEKWDWSKSRVDRFLKLLAAEGMIEVRTKNGATADHAAGQGQSIITICNYEKYQAPEGIDRGNDEPQSGATSGQHRTKEETGNNTSEDKSSSVVSIARERKADPFPRPDFADPQVWADFMLNRKRKRMTNSATAYRDFLRSIDAEQDENWSPGRLLEHATAKGWGSIHNPDKDDRNELPRRTARPASQQSSRAARLKQSLLDAEAERGNVIDYPLAGRALPAQRWDQ